MPITFDSFKALAGDVNATRFSGDDSTVHLAQGEAGGMKLATGQWVRIWKRNDAIRAENLSVRQQLLDAISDRFGGLANIPDAVRNVMKIGKFDLDKDGRVQSHKPLTMRRIKLIVKAAEDFVCNARFDAGALQAQNGRSGVNIIHADQFDNCVNLYNRLSREKFDIHNLFEFHTHRNEHPENRELAKSFLKDIDSHFHENANRIGKGMMQTEFIIRMGEIVQNRPTQFSADYDRSNIVTAGGKILPRKSEEATLDAIAGDLTGGRCTRFADLTPIEKGKVNIVRALTQQFILGASDQMLMRPLNAKAGLANQFTLVALAKDTYTQSNLYHYSFDADGGITISGACYKDSKAILLDYLGQEHPEADSPMMEGDIKYMQRIDIHIPADEVNRFANPATCPDLSSIDYAALEEGSSKANVAGGDVLEQNARLLPENCKINLDVHFATKIIVND